MIERLEQQKKLTSNQWKLICTANVADLLDFFDFFLMILIQNFFGSGNYSIVGPYMGEMWPARLRGSGMGFVYGVGNLGKFIGPAGLALIAGSSNFVSPQATLDALIPGFNYFAFWYVLGAAAFWFIGMETRGRTIDEIERELRRPARVTQRTSTAAGN